MRWVKRFWMQLERWQGKRVCRVNQEPEWVRAGFEQQLAEEASNFNWVEEWEAFHQGDGTNANYYSSSPPCYPE